MDSITKRKLNNDEISLLALRAFGEKIQIKAIKELEDGWFNAIYQITFGDGKEVVLKVSPNPDIEVLAYEERIMETEVKVMKLLREEYSMPVPEIYFYDSSRKIINNEFYFMEKIEGSPYNQIKEELSEEIRNKIGIQIGELNKRINNIKNDSFGNIVIEDRRSSSWKIAFLNMVELLLKDGEKAEVKLPRSYDYIKKLFQHNAEVLASVKVAKLVHWDLHDGNIFVNKETNEVSGIIDFERAFWGDPLIEFYFGDFCGKDSFIEGYGINLLQEESSLPRRILYNIYLGLVMVIECKYRRVEDPQHLEWTYSNLEKEIIRLEKEKGLPT